MLSLRTFPSRHPGVLFKPRADLLPVSFFRSLGGGAGWVARQFVGRSVTIKLSVYRTCLETALCCVPSSKRRRSISEMFQPSNCKMSQIRRVGQSFRLCERPPSMVGSFTILPNEILCAVASF